MHRSSDVVNGLSKTLGSGERAERSANFLMTSAWKNGPNELDDRAPTDMKRWRHCSRGSCPSGQRTQCVWSCRDRPWRIVWRTSLAGARGFTRKRLATRSCQLDQKEFWQLLTVWWKWVRAQKRLRSRGSWVSLKSPPPPPPHPHHCVPHTLRNTPMSTKLVACGEGADVEKVHDGEW